MRVVHELGGQKKNPGVNFLKKLAGSLAPQPELVVELGPEEQR